MELQQGRLRLGVRKSSDTRGCLGIGIAPQHTAPGCHSSVSTWTTLSDTGFIFWVVLGEAVIETG